MSNEAETSQTSQAGDEVHTYECRECGEAHDCTSKLRHCPDCGGSVKRTDSHAGAWTSSLAHGTELEPGSSSDQA